jgi:hypothetical protein
MTDDLEPVLAPCRVITSRDLMTLNPQPMYSYSLCNHAAPSRPVGDGTREDRLPVCNDHWERLFGEDGEPAFSIDSALPGEPVVEPHWMA